MKRVFVVVGVGLPAVVGVGLVFSGVFAGASEEPTVADDHLIAVDGEYRL